MFRRARSVLIASTACALVFATTTVVGASVVASAATAGLLPGSSATTFCRRGENGNGTLLDIVGNKLFGARPPHNDDQLDSYAGLANSYRGLTDAGLRKFFNDSSFGVAPSQVEKRYTPRSNATIVRDKRGIPHI